jgi:hypothetical protein
MYYILVVGVCQCFQYTESIKGADIISAICIYNKYNVGFDLDTVDCELAGIPKCVCRAMMLVTSIWLCASLNHYYNGYILPRKYIV